jgi:NTP pyrophosphatase (non-canonical NTP hydrolase)
MNTPHEPEYIHLPDDTDWDVANAGRFVNWPENLPREELIRLARGYAAECHQVEQIIAAAFPAEFPLGDGEALPTHERATGDHTPTTMAMRAARAISELRAARCPTQPEVAAWLTDNFGPHRCVEQQALVLAEEVGEVCRAIVKRAQGIRGSRAEWTERLHAELADVAITLLAVAATEGFDLHAATARKWADVTSRDASAHRMPNEVTP